MSKRFVVIWFRYLHTDWFTLRQPDLAKQPFVLSASDHGRMVITSSNALAKSKGINKGMAVADARVILPSLQVLDDKPDLAQKLLHRIGEWCIRFTPFVSIDLPDGLILDITGCPHLWGGDSSYLNEIIKRLNNRGYHVNAAMADTIGAAWAISRYGKTPFVIENNQQSTTILSLPPESLRLDIDTIERLHKLGLRQIRDFIAMPRPALRRRFGQQLIQRMNQALGYEEEIIRPLEPIETYQERLPSLEPIVTATGIEIALQQLLDKLCDKLQKEGKGLRSAVLKCYRVDGKTEKIEIGTHRPSCNVKHLFKLFELKIPTIEPDLGIELFVLEAPKVEDHSPTQEKIWNNNFGLEHNRLSELLDRLSGRFGNQHILRYLPDEHYWPERSVKPATTLNEELTTDWKIDRPRPLQLLSKPEPIEVTAPIPDYPPMNFRYKNKIHKVIKADGPERIEQEWWIQQGQHRDYYYVEDEEGCRYWLFRLGHYTDSSFQWFIHGFFA